MKKRYEWMLLLGCALLMPAIAHAQPEASGAIPPPPQDMAALPPSPLDAIPDVTPMPPLPAGEVFDPSNPMPAVPVTPIAPVQVPDIKVKKGDEATSLPTPKNDEEFKFFQPGYQWQDDGSGNDKNTTETKPEPAPAPKVEKKKPVYWVDQFDYHNQRLPLKIYKKAYNSENNHLPIAQFESDYDAYTFNAAARNDLFTLRAMINAGRDLHMINGYGETLLGVAARHNAHDTVRYLLAKGLSPATADAGRVDYQTRVALRSVR